MEYIICLETNLLIIITQFQVHFQTMNPWAVNNLRDFLYYCCPECEEKVKSLETFLQHALNKHDLAKEILPKIIVKEEFDEQYNDDYDTVSEII